MERERGKKLRRCGLPPVRKSTLPWWIVRWGLREKNESQERARTHARTHARTNTHIDESTWDSSDERESGVAKHATRRQSADVYEQVTFHSRVKGCAFFSFFRIGKVSMQILVFC